MHYFTHVRWGRFRAISGFRRGDVDCKFDLTPAFTNGNTAKRGSNALLRRMSRLGPARFIDINRWWRLLGGTFWTWWFIVEVHWRLLIWLLQSRGENWRSAEKFCKKSAKRFRKVSLNWQYFLAYWQPYLLFNLSTAWTMEDPEVWGGSRLGAKLP